MDVSFLGFLKIEKFSVPYTQFEHFYIFLCSLLYCSFSLKDNDELLSALWAASGNQYRGENLSLLVVGSVLQKPLILCLPQQESIAIEMIAEIPDSTSLPSQQGLIRGEAILTKAYNQHCYYQNGVTVLLPWKKGQLSMMKLKCMNELCCWVCCSSFSVWCCLTKSNSLKVYVIW